MRRSIFSLVLVSLIASMTPATADVGAVVVSTTSNYLPGGTQSGSGREPHVPLVVPQGYEIRYVNLDRDEEHSLSATGCWPGNPGGCPFSSGYVAPLETVVLDTAGLTAGTYGFICLRHYSTMAGEFTVV